MSGTPSPGRRRLTVRYFASLRERTGIGSETVEIGDDIVTVQDLVAVLRRQTPAVDQAFEAGRGIRAAIDRTHASMTAPIGGANEVGFFPPVTGG